MSQNYTYPPGFATSVNPSIGLNGSAAPLSSTLVGGKNPSNNLEPLLVDASGNLLISIGGDTFTPLPTTDAADGSVTGGTAGTKSILVGVQFNTSLPSLTSGQQAAWQSDSSGRAIISPLTTSSVIKTDLQDGSGNAITSTTNALDVNLKTSSITLTISGTVIANQGSANATPWNENIAQFGGSSVSLGSKVSASSIPIVIASDQTVPISAVSLPLPTLASTSTLQSTGNTSLASIATNTTGLNNTITTSGTAFPTEALQIGVRNGSNLVAVTQGSATSANSIPIVIASDQASVAVKGSLSPTTGRSVANAPIQNIYSSTNITTGAYVQLVASTTSTINYIDIFDSSGQAMIFGVGAAASEVIQAYIPPGGDQIPLAIPSGSRIAYKALSANATTGYLIMSFYT